MRSLETTLLKVRPRWWLLQVDPPRRWSHRRRPGGRSREVGPQWRFTRVSPQPPEGLHRDPQPLALGASILEPKLDVLGLQLGELLAVGHAVELLGVLEDEVVTRVSVDSEPLLQPRHLRHRVDEGPVPLAAFFGRTAAPETAREGRHLTDGE